MSSGRLGAVVLVALALALGACTFRTGGGHGGGEARGAGGPLHIRYLGVGGFLVERGSDAVLTAPLFTRPTWLEVSGGTIASNPDVVARSLPAPAIANVRAVLVGHAHYDHLLDVPTVMLGAPRATLFGNVSTRNVVAAYAPDRAPYCAGRPAPPGTIARNRVVALDDPGRSFVDYSLCPARRPPNAPAAGTWVQIPGAAMRILALCSDHPEQVGPIHYAKGSVDTEQCTPPMRAAEWLEGQTLAFLVDFLDPASGAPVYRVFYQDAPTNAPVGLVPAAVLREKRIDVALLCVGAYEHVNDAPTQTLLGLNPRFAIGGHWEDFLRPASEPVQPIPLMNLDTWVMRARFALPRGGPPMLENGAPMAERFAVPRAGETFDVWPAN
ncbi:MAG: hypothetical protein U0270_41820 [Labilithrix sp.]